jgi:tetratricopeptide (TPR) repeat protein
LLATPLAQRLPLKQALNTLEPLYSEQPDNEILALELSRVYAEMGQKDSALKAAERAVMLLPRAKDAVDGPIFEENLALIQTIVGEKSPAISTLTQLLKTPYGSWLYNGTPITAAILRLDPLWDPLRSDPRFQRLLASPAPKNR